MTKDQAKRIMAEVLELRHQLDMDASMSDPCFWCCGGGIEREMEIGDMEKEVLAIFPELAPQE